MVFERDNSEMDGISKIDISEMDVFKRDTGRQILVKWIVLQDRH